MEKYNANVAPLHFVAAIMFFMLEPRISKGVINKTRNSGPSVVGNDGSPSQTNFNNHDSRVNRKRIIFFVKKREGRQEIVDQKSQKADLLATKQNKKAKGEFEMIDHIGAKMEGKSQETHQNVIKTCWDIITEAHKIVI
jgi:hypothetical protein